MKNDKQNPNWVLTPHPGEANRLLSGALSGAKDLGSDDGDVSGVLESGIQADRFKSVRLLQEYYGGTVLLKGAGTLVSDGKETSLCPLGNPGMATAGMGDVLSGIIGCFLAQGMDGFRAANAGVFLHAMAGDQVADDQGEKGMIATDLIPIVRRLVNG